jgi:ABC-type lipoprotein release transport system permease subunit
MRLGWRSIWRVPRRTVIDFSAAGIGLVLAILAFGMADGFTDQARSDVGNTGLGHVHLYAPGWRDEPEAGRALASPGALVEAARALPGAKASARVLAPALLATAWGNRDARVIGVDPEAEAQVSRFFHDVREGELLRAGDDRGILLGERLARRLKARVGAKVRVSAQGRDGELGAELFRVRGIFHGVAPSVSDGVAYTTRAAAARLLGLGDAAHQVVVELPAGADVDAAAASLRAKVGTGVEVVTYFELMPFLRKTLELTGQYVAILIGVVFLLVGMGILNTMLMSVLERTREFGVMMAVGTLPLRIVAQVLAEAFWIATLAVAGGLVLGLAVNWLFARHGILDYTESLGEAYEMGGAALSSVFKTRFSVARALEAAGIVWVLTALVGLYPAWRVSRLQPADALRRG